MNVLIDRIKDLQKTMGDAKVEHAKQVKERDIKIEFMQQEMKKNVNILYIKNILIKFFNSDFSVSKQTNSFYLCLSSRLIWHYAIAGQRENTSSNINSASVLAARKWGPY